MSKTALSVIMPVYYKDNAEHFHQALASIFNQSQIAQEVIVIKDGELTPALEEVLAHWQKINATLKTVALPVNKGLSAALNEGIKAAQNTWIARMDADDICSLDRFEKQVNYLNKHPEISIIGSWIDEFDESITKPIATRKLPESHAQILRYARWRCPFNHMTVMYKKDVVQKLGAYKNFGAVGDDYELWARFLTKGYKAANIQESLVYARANADFFNNRRRGLKYFKNEVKEINELYRLGLLNPMHYIFHFCIKAIVRFSPPGLVRFFYHYIRKFS
jgi:glycosyltransferase involved in cell wall biosynthesis